MKVQPRLLDHPFYQARTRDDVPPEVLAQYHQAYGEFVPHLRKPGIGMTAQGG